MILNFISFINEMAKIDKKGNKLSINNVPLKNTAYEVLDDNTIFYREEKGNFLFPKDYTMVWFLDDDTFVKKFTSGEENLIYFPPRRIFNLNSSPISDLWKKNTPIQKHIIGCIKGITNDDLIYIDMMSVRPGFKKNGINYHMINTLIRMFPKAQLKFSKPTDEGKLFIQKHFPDAKITE